MAHARREPPAGFRYEMVAREVRLKLSRTTFRRLSAARAEAGRLQRRLVRLHHRIREHQHRWPTAVELERRRRNLLHQASRLVVDWCVAHEVGDLVLGDGLTGLHQTRSGEVSLHLNQVMSSSLQARFEQQVAYKCQRVGLAIRDEDERFTTRTCPACGALNSPRQRTSCCRTCSYSGPRDAVGAANLLNRIQHAGRIVPGMLVPDPGRIMYRLPARLWAGQRRAPAMGRAGSSPPVAVAAWPGDDGTAFRSPRKAE